MDLQKFLTFSMKISIFVLIIADNISGDFGSRYYKCARNDNECLQFRRRACCDTASRCQKKNDTFICLKKAFLGDTCIENSDCHDNEFVECSNNICICTPNTIAVNSYKCEPQLQSPCTMYHDCKVENSICIDYSCQCSPDYLNRGSKCLPKNLGGACEKNSDCYNIGNAVCSDRKCVCRSDHINSAKNKCSQALGSFCSESTFPCPIQNSRCIDNWCRCKADHIIIDKHQCEPITLGKSCTFNSQYVSHKFICSDDKIFVCNKNYTSNNKGCDPVLNGACSEDNQCRKGFQCVNNKCQCKPDHVPLSIHQCIEPIYVPSCINSLDCMDPWHAQCSNKKCICTTNHIAINNITCYPLLGGYCWIQRQCLTPNSECVDYQCRCKKNFFPLSDNLCEKKINFQ